MKKNKAEIILNPTRQRILQYLAINKKGTTKEIKSALSDIPPASLYRQIKVLLDAGMIEVVEEKKIRGTVEKTYSMKNELIDPNNHAELDVVIQTALCLIGQSFQDYFARKDADPQRDLLSFGTATLLLSDEEFETLFREISCAITKVLHNTPAENRKPRRITFISSPEEDWKP